MTDVLVIGAGSAGLTASIYIIRAGLNCIILEKNIYGGQIALTSEVENYPGLKRITGVDLATNLYEQAQELGADIRFEAVTEVDFSSPVKIVKTPNQTYEAKAVIIANGVNRRKLGCPGEDALTGRGVSYCATCDGAFFRNKTVAVVGGGNTALEDALFLANVCKKVYLIHRRDTFRAEKILENAVFAKDNIVPIFDTTVEEIHGTESVSQITIQNKKSGSQEQLDVEGVFIAIGLLPDNTMFSSYLPLDKDGYFAVDETCATNIPGVYVAGDSRQKILRQIITAASDGAVAGFLAANYVNQETFPQT